MSPRSESDSVLTLGHMAKSTQVSISHTRGFWAILTQACVSSWLPYSKRNAHAHRSACAFAKTGSSALQTLSIKHDWYSNTWPLLSCILSFIALDRRLLVTPHLTECSSDSSNISKMAELPSSHCSWGSGPFGFNPAKQKSQRQHSKPAVISEAFCLHGVQLKGVAGQQ